MGCTNHTQEARGLENFPRLGLQSTDEKTNIFLLAILQDGSQGFFAGGIDDWHSPHAKDEGADAGKMLSHFPFKLACGTEEQSPFDRENRCLRAILRLVPDGAHLAFRICRIWH